METLIIERTTPTDVLFHFMDAAGEERLRVAKEKDSATATIAPIINPDDYDNDTDYLNAIPGLMAAINAEFASPMSEDVEVPEDWIAQDV